MYERYSAPPLEKSQRCDYDIMMALLSTADVVARLTGIARNRLYRGSL